jgi:hypothetical protein
VVHDKTLRAFLDSYLRFAPRPHEAPLALAALKAAEEQLARDVFIVYARLSTNKESPTAFLSVAKYADVVYESGMLDVIAILDLCAIFAATNGPLLSRMIAHVFKLQPKYNMALGAACAHVASSLEHISASDLSSHELSGLLLDLGIALHQFFTLCRPATQAFLEHQFLLSLARFYDTLVGKHAALLKAGEGASVHTGLYAVLQAIDALVETAFSSSQGNTDQLLFWLTELLDLPLFLRDYCGCFPLAPRVQALQRGGGVDAVCADHMLQCVGPLDAAFLAPAVLPVKTHTPKAPSSSSSSSRPSAAAAASPSVSSAAGLGSKAAGPVAKAGTAGPARGPAVAVAAAASASVSDVRVDGGAARESVNLFVCMSERERCRLVCLACLFPILRDRILLC